MDGIEAAGQERPAALRRPDFEGIFLHAGWRSCGTWVWESLRNNAAIRAFYEPLHEGLGALRAPDIGLLRPDSWQSGHGSGAPYFAEYAGLLRPRGGVHGHALRFAFDDYFRPAIQDDPALEAYLRGLIAEARTRQQTPALKFCRSLGRVPWMEARFPDMFHAVVLRDPLAQWWSARRQMERNGNRYFVVAPFVIMARNANNALLADAAARLNVKLPPVLGRSLTGDLNVTMDACWRHVSRLSWNERFHGFLAFWLAGSVASLQGKAAVIDADLLSQDAATCASVESALAAACGLPVDLNPDGDREIGPKADPADETDAQCALAAGLDFVAAQVSLLDAGRIEILTAKMRAGQFAAQALAARGACKADIVTYADAAAYVAFMRLSYPMRRAHYHVRRWIDRCDEGMPGTMPLDPAKDRSLEP